MVVEYKNGNADTAAPTMDIDDMLSDISIY